MTNFFAENLFIIENLQNLYFAPVDGLAKIIYQINIPGKSSSPCCNKMESSYITNSIIQHLSAIVRHFFLTILPYLNFILRFHPNVYVCNTMARKYSYLIRPHGSTACEHRRICGVFPAFVSRCRKYNPRTQTHLAGNRSVFAG